MKRDNRYRQEPNRRQDDGKARLDAVEAEEPCAEVAGERPEACEAEAQLLESLFFAKLLCTL